MKHTLRPLFAALAAALALACARLTGNGGVDAREHRAGWAEHNPRAEPATHAAPPLARVLVRGGLALDGPGRRPGAPPRMAAGTNPSRHTSFAARATVRRAAAARTRQILNLSLARRLAAARDGTLCARSTGVPPPFPA